MNVRGEVSNMLQPNEMTDEQLLSELKLIDKLRNTNVIKLLDGEVFPKSPNIAVTARGEMFNTEKDGIVPRLVEKMYEQRSAIKKKQIEVMKQIQTSNSDQDKNLDKLNVQFYNQQLALKILMNALYGTMSNKFFRYFDERIAESITLTAQLTIRWAENTINKFLNEKLETNNVDYVIASDTDSLYINFGPFVEKFSSNTSLMETQKFLDNFCEDIVTPILEKAYDELKDRMNCNKQKMVMKREAIANKGIWTGKKHYILNVMNNEGVQYTEPKLKMVGIEAVKSSTPYFCRQLIKDCIHVIMNRSEKEVQKFVDECYDLFCKQRAEDIAFPRGVSDIEKYIDHSAIYKKATPIHVRAAIVYNNCIDSFGLDSKYQKISSAEKIKFIYLKMPNPIKENVIAFSTALPDEFNLTNFIDYKTQFDKAFLSPIKSILEVIGWSHEEKIISTLEEFFV